MSGHGEPSVFVVARNPQDDSKLPYLLRLPLEGGLVLKARERWPTTAGSARISVYLTGSSGGVVTIAA